MFEVTLERMRDGETLELTHNEERWQLTEVDGLEVPEIDIATYDIASVDGSKISNIKMPDRDIIITLAIKGNVDNNRRLIHNLVRIRSIMRIHFRTDSRQVYIDGYLKSIESNRFSELTMMDITFNCPDPFFKAEIPTEASMSRIYPVWVFPFPYPGVRDPEGELVGDIHLPAPMSIIDPLRTATIMSVSENETGIIIQVSFRYDANKVLIVSADTGNRFTVTYPFKAGDILEINTISGQKSVTVTHESMVTSIMAYVADGSDFFQLSSGENGFSYIIDDDINVMSAEMVFIFTPIFFAI